jgi:hypothetical protein
LGMHAEVSSEIIRERLTWALNNPMAVRETGQAAARLMDETNLTCEHSVVTALMEKGSIPIGRS